MPMTFGPVTLILGIYIRQIPLARVIIFIGRKAGEAKASQL